MIQAKSTAIAHKFQDNSKIINKLCQYPNEKKVYQKNDRLNLKGKEWALTEKRYLLLSCAAFFFGMTEMAVAADIINQNYAEKSSGTYGVGGALTFAPPEVSLIKDSSFTNNRSAIGGAIVSRGYISSVSNSIFQGNISETGGGGAIYSQTLDGHEDSNSGSIDKISNVQFLGNSAAGFGGGVFHLSPRDVLVENTLFEGNHGEKGGGAFNSGQYDNRGAVVTMVNTQFRNNTSGRVTDGTFGGGAIRLDSGSVIFKGNNVFENNKDPEKNNDINVQSGTVIVAESAVVTLDGGIIGNGNTVIEKGGQIIVENSVNAATFGNQTENNGTITVNKEKAADVLAEFTNNGQIANQGDFTVQDTGSLILNRGIDGSGRTTVSEGGRLVANAAGVAMQNALINNGTVNIDKDNGLILKHDSVNNGTVDNNGLLVVNKSLLLRSSIQGEGTVSVNNGALLDVVGEDAQIVNNIDNRGILRVNENSQLTAEREIANYKVIVNRGVIHNNGALLLNGGSSVEMGTDAVFNTKELRASGLPQLKLNVETDTAANTIRHGIINVDGDVAGNTDVVLKVADDNLLTSPETVKSLFVNAPQDNAETSAAFNVVRVEKSPYMWVAQSEAGEGDQGTAWYLTVNTLVPETPDSLVVAPEVVAAAGMHEAALEQTRSVLRNLNGKLASGREYCPNCGIYSQEWDGRPLHNLWVSAQGETAGIDKPVDMDADIWGVEAGFDLQNDVNNTFGVFASYRNGEYDLSGRGAKLHALSGSKIDIDSYLAGFYYRYDKNMNWLFAGIYGGMQRADVKTDDGIAEFDSDGVEFGAGVEAGHTFALSSDLTLSPGLGIYYTQIDFDSATDNVGKRYDWSDVKHLEAEFGIKLEKQIDTAKIYVKPSVIHTLTDDDEVKISGYGKADTYHDQTLGRIELGGRYGFSDAVSGYGWTNYTFGSGYDNITLGAGLSYAW